MKTLDKIKNNKNSKLIATGVVASASYLTFFPNKFVKTQPSNIVKFIIGGISAYVLYYLWMSKSTNVAPEKVVGDTKTTDKPIKDTNVMTSPAEKVGDDFIDPKQINRDFMALQRKQGQTAKPELEKAGETFFMSLSQNMLKDYKNLIDMVLRDKRYAETMSKEMKDKLLKEYQLTEKKLFDMTIIFAVSVEKILKGTYTGNPTEKTNIDFTDGTVT